MKIRHMSVGFVFLALSGAASGSIVGVSGAASQIAQPADARFNQITSSSLVFVWNEAQNFALTSGLNANARNPGLYNGFGDLENFQIPGEQYVNSHFIHFDSPGSQAGTASGSVTFDGDILGVICVNEAGQRDLDNSDFLGAPTLFTHGNSNRGLELAGAGDRFSISPDGRTIEFHFTISTPGDYIRVVTQVPAPGSLALLGAGGMALARRRRS